MLELLIDSPAFDFIGAGTDIDRYCLQHDIPPKVKNRLHLALEELVRQILLPQEIDLPLQVTIEYAAKEEAATLTAVWPGASFDPRRSDNALSLSVLQGAARSIDYRYDPDSPEPNRVEIRLK